MLSSESGEPPRIDMAEEDVAVTRNVDWTWEASRLIGASRVGDAATLHGQRPNDASLHAMYGEYASSL